MKTRSHVELSFSQMLFAWLAHRITSVVTTIRPAYRADQIAAAVAASNNPSGV